MPRILTIAFCTILCGLPQLGAIAQEESTPWNPSPRERELFGHACSLINQGTQTDGQIKNAVAVKFVQQVGGALGAQVEAAAQFALHFGHNGLLLYGNCDAQNWDMEQVAAFQKEMRVRWEVAMEERQKKTPAITAGENQ